MRCKVILGYGSEGKASVDKGHSDATIISLDFFLRFYYQLILHFCFQIWKGHTYPKISGRWLAVPCPLETTNCGVNSHNSIKNSHLLSFMQIHNVVYYIRGAVQFSSVTQLCPTLCDPMNRSMRGLPVHHQLPELTQTHVYLVGDATQPSHLLSVPSPPAPNPSQHQDLFQ